MRVVAVSVLILLSLRGQVPNDASPNTDTPRSSMRLEGVDLYMHDYTPTAGKLREPTIWVHAASGQLAAGEQVWSLQNTRAVIYREDDEDLVVEAATGEFDQEKELAKLAGSVRLTSGELVVDLESLDWDNANGTATSNEAVRVTTGNMWLLGNTIRMNPDEDTLVLTEASGYIPLADETP